MQDLIDRIASEKGPNRSLDGEIALLLRQVPSEYPKRSFRQPYLWSDYGAGLHARTWVADKYSSSIDVALNLAEKLLPEHRFSLFTDGGGKGPTCLIMIGDDPVVAEARAASLPLAILKGLLMALSRRD